MRFISGDDFDPLCESRLVIEKAHLVPSGSGLPYRQCMAIENMMLNDPLCYSCCNNYSLDWPGFELEEVSSAWSSTNYCTDGTMSVGGDAFDLGGNWGCRASVIPLNQICTSFWGWTNGGVSPALYRSIGLAVYNYLNEGYMQAHITMLWQRSEGPLAMGFSLAYFCPLFRCTGGEFMLINDSGGGFGPCRWEYLTSSLVYIEPDIPESVTVTGTPL